MVARTVVLYPSPGIAHLVSVVEFGKLIIKHHPSFSLTYLVTINNDSVASYISHVSKTTPSINFHYLPSSSNKETSPIEHLHLNIPHVQQALQTISTSSTIPAFITSYLDLPDQINLPIFYFFTSNTSVLSILLHLPTVHKTTVESFKDMNTFLNFPGVPPIHSSDMIQPLLDRTNKAYDWFLSMSYCIPKCQGIIVNTFDSLERRSPKPITEGLSVPDALTSPPIYCIGPLIGTDDQIRTAGCSGDMTCLEWLDLQPRRSVVYLCFGRKGEFTEAQLKEIAMGLEKSGHRFLWVVRSPPNENHADINLDALLPDGFLERTKERGKVVKSWALQVEVLSKESLGGFVTHCGWNSVLEAVCAGIPMVAWPLYAEQKINRVILVEELKVALPMESDEDGFVGAQEVEKKVRELMEGDDGRLIQERVVNLRGDAKEAVSDGGSSVRALSALAEVWKG